ncbi:polyprenol reductase [Cephus cinctus]|uniref:Polyprenal reductase n=1 Tax=Cephus cinctus TaxID=211228 RepID=A0AAJ7BXP2_CEPCN|nr:polyprenol reductase [Cephus cinctus]
MDLNPIQLVFLANSVFVAGVGILIHLIEPHLPILLTRTYRYGKSSVKLEQPVVARVEVPKRWFAHFYAFSAPVSTIVLALIVYRYFYNGIPPEIIYQTLDRFFDKSRKPLVPAANTLLAGALLTIQCSKRFYESYFVSIFSDGKMNLIHYAAGFIHYVGAITCIIGESEGFVRGSQDVTKLTQLTLLDYGSAFVFLWSCYKQLRSNYILVALRKNEKGVVVTKGYKVPHGELFEYISAPLQFTEILMYVSLDVILWKSRSYHYVFWWVLINQCECALTSHRWYQKTFKNYPKNRKALIPLVL